MKKFIVVTLVILAFIVAYEKFRMPEIVRVNQETVQQCTEDMSINPDLLCD